MANSAAGRAGDYATTRGQKRGQSGEQTVSGLHCCAAQAPRSAATTSATTAAASASAKPQEEGTMTDQKPATRDEWLAARLTLASQRVVVVGGTSGIGAATVLA